MKKFLLFFWCVGAVAMAQKTDQSVFIEYARGEGYYYETILKDAESVKDSLKPEEPFRRFSMDQSDKQLPNKVDLYNREWANPVISQGNAGTCWAYSTISFYESEIFRQTNKQVKLSEIYIAYWEYVEKARRFVQERGHSLFAEGSEANAVARMAGMHGMVP